MERPGGERNDVKPACHRYGWRINFVFSPKAARPPHDCAGFGVSQGERTISIKKSHIPAILKPSRCSGRSEHDQMT